MGWVILSPTKTQGADGCGWCRQKRSHDDQRAGTRRRPDARHRRGRTGSSRERSPRSSSSATRTSRSPMALTAWNTQGAILRATSSPRRSPRPEAALGGRSRHPLLRCGIGTKPNVQKVAGHHLRGAGCALRPNEARTRPICPYPACAPSARIPLGPKSAARIRQGARRTSIMSRTAPSGRML